MKKILILLVFLLAVLIPQVVEAKTLQDAYDEIKILEQNAAKNKAKQQITQEEIKQIKIEINNIAVEIVSIEQETKRLKEEIILLDKKIKVKEQEIKDLFKYYQLSNGESAYLEYAFGAQTMSDFIYRVAIVEQLSKYNKELVSKMNQMIKDNIKKGEELKKKEEELETKKQEYARRQALLVDEMRSLNESYTEISDDIKRTKELLAFYIVQGCKLTDDLSKCAGGLVPNTVLKRPLKSGIITSDYGPRILSISNLPFHYGIDIAGLPIGTPVYSPASGIIVDIGYYWESKSGGMGNNVWMIFIYKNEYYTVGFFHLSTINVKKGQSVTSETIIGTLGNTGNSTGAHLHFELAKGARYVVGGAYGIPSNKTYTLYNDHLNKVINPRNLFSFPAVGGWFSTR